MAAAPQLRCLAGGAEGAGEAATLGELYARQNFSLAYSRPCGGVALGCDVGGPSDRSTRGYALMVFDREGASSEVAPVQKTVTAPWTSNETALLA